MCPLNLCFEQKHEKYQTFLSENFHVLVVKFSVYLNKRVFIMFAIKTPSKNYEKILIWMPLLYRAIMIYSGKICILYGMHLIWSQEQRCSTKMLIFANASFLNSCITYPLIPFFILIKQYKQDLGSLLYYYYYHYFCCFFCFIVSVIEKA